MAGSNYRGESSPEGVYVLRYTTDGQPLWQSSWTSPNGGPVWGGALAVTPDGGAAIGVFYAAPGFDEPGESDTAVIAKFDADGQLAWSTPVVLGTRDDEFWTLGARKDGTIIGLGISDFTNPAAVKIAPSGTLVWSSRYTIPGRSFDARWIGFSGTAGVFAGPSWSDNSPYTRSTLLRFALP